MPCQNEILWWLLSDRALFSVSLLLSGSGAWHFCYSFLSCNFHSSKIYNASCDMDLHGTSSVHVSINISVYHFCFFIILVKPLISRHTTRNELSNFQRQRCFVLHLVGQSIFLSQHATTHLEVGKKVAPEPSPEIIGQSQVSTI